MTVGYLGELLITLAVAWIYLTIVRLVDVNEREPVWALATVFVLGLLAACVVELLVGSERLLAPLWHSALTVELAKLIALVLGVAIFSAIARVRGWSEFSDLTDGIVYGIAVGLGYSAGETLVRQLATADVLAVHTGASPLRTVLNVAAVGLQHGVFAAVSGLGVGAALAARSRVAEALWTILGLAGATLLDGLFRILAHGNALGGEEGHVRAWLAVILPLVLLATVGIILLVAERRTIRAELAGEVRSGVVTADEAALLDSFWRRQLTYLGLLLRGEIGRCLHLAGLHNRQVQLALLKRQAERESDPAHRQRMERRVELVRSAIRHARTLALFILLLAGAGSLTASRPVPAKQTQDWANLDSLVGATHRYLDEYWGKTLGVLYRAPAGVGPYPVLSFFCRFKKNNAEYCRQDRNIYYDPGFLDSLWHSTGDYAAAWVIAHEYGHLVQDLRGELDPSKAWWTIQIELGADCLAGQFTRAITAEGHLDSHDEDEAILSIRRGGDVHGTPWFETGAHGRAGQRIDAFSEGREGRSCEGPEFEKAVGIEGATARLQPTPLSGPLLDNTSCRRGRFDRTDIHTVPEALNDAVNDAVIATFKSVDGVEVTLFKLAARNAAAAQLQFDAQVATQLSQNHFSVTKSGPVKDANGQEIGGWKLLDGPDQMVVLRNGQVVEVYEGPAGATWEFFNATPVYDCAPIQSRLFPSWFDSLLKSTPK